MSSEEKPLEEELLLPWLLAHDNALAGGTTSQDVPAADPPGELQPRLAGDLACIQVLRHVLARKSAEQAQPTPQLPLQQLARFRIHRELGHGAFGIVFLASDPQLGRDVALKVPRPEVLVTAELRQRFVREARAAAGLDHPNLVPIYEAGEIGPICYIASAYCPGTTLGDWLKERTEAVPPRQAAWLSATLAEAVQHAHERGVIHRDLKPSNILLQRRAHEDTVDPAASVHAMDATIDFVPRITDFGLAKLMADAPGETAVEEGARTRSGAVVGTPAYMAPEQACGKIREIGPAADIHALGVILYELLTGRIPFLGETVLDTLEQVRSQEPLPPHRLRPKLPRDLETICLHCLQKEPHKRYASAGELAADLHRYLAGEPIRARPIRVWERGIKWALRKPAQAFLLAASILGPLMLLIVVMTYNAQLRQALAAKDEKQQEANKNLRLAGSAIEDFATKLGHDKRLLAYNLEDLRKEYLQSAMNMWRLLLHQHPEGSGQKGEYARSIRQFGRLIQEMGGKQEAIDFFQKAVTILQELVSVYPKVPQYQDELAMTLNCLAIVNNDIHQTNLAEDIFQQELDIRQQLVFDYPTVPGYRSKLADNHNNLALLYMETGRPKQAENAHLKARDLWLVLLRDYPKVEEYQSSLVDSYFNLGLLYEYTSRLELAEEYYSRSCRQARELVHDHLTIPAYQDALGKSLTNLGLVYVETKRAEQAVKAYREAEGIYQKLADDHPKIPNYPDNLGRVHHNLGQAYDQFRRPDLAEAAYGKARDRRRQLIRDYPTIPDYRVALARTLNNMGNLFCDNGRPIEANAALGESRSIREQLVHDYPDVTDFRVSLGNTYSTLGLMEMAQGKHQAALDWLDRSVRILEAVLKKEPRQTFARQYMQEAYQRRVTALCQLNRFDDALHDLDRLLELADGVKTDPWRLLRADALARMGQHVQAMTETNTLSSRPSVPDPTLYNLACVCSVCSTAARQDIALHKAEQDHFGEQYAARAVEFLKKAKAAGYFKPAARMEEMRKDKDLDVLRQRLDFQELFPHLHRRKP